MRQAVKAFEKCHSQGSFPGNEMKISMQEFYEGMLFESTIMGGKRMEGLHTVKREVEL